MADFKETFKLIEDSSVVYKKYTLRVKNPSPLT